MNRLDQVERQIHQYVSGDIEETTAPKLGDKSSLGKKKWRFTIDGLDQRGAIAILNPNHRPIWGYHRVVVILKQSEANHLEFSQVMGMPVHEDRVGVLVYINTNSLKNRLDLPKCLDFGRNRDQGQKRFNQIIQLAREKLLFQVSREDDTFVDSKDSLDHPLLPLGSLVPTLVPKERMRQISRLHDRSYRLSKHWYKTEASIYVMRDGFIATDTKEVKRVYNEIFNEKEKISITPEGERVVRRTMKVLGYGCDGNARRGSGNVRYKTYTAFKRKVGILDTYSVDFCLNKDGTIKLVSFHPDCENTLFDFLGQTYAVGPRKDTLVIAKWKGDRPTKKDKMEMVHQLLQGMYEISKENDFHGLNQHDIQIRKIEKSFQAVIDIQNGLRFRKNHPDSTFVWNMGELIFRFLSKQRYSCLGNCFEGIGQQELEAFIKLEEHEFPPKIETLILGMAQRDSQKRWTPEQCLKYFEKCVGAPLVPVLEEKKEE